MLINDLVMDQADGWLVEHVQGHYLGGGGLGGGGGLLCTTKTKVNTTTQVKLQIVN